MPYESLHSGINEQDMYDSLLVCINKLKYSIIKSIIKSRAYRYSTAQSVINEIRLILYILQNSIQFSKCFITDMK